jgi:Flagellar transcriptional activator (FlhD)
MKEKEKEQAKGSGNWRQKIKHLNLHYLHLVKLIGSTHENPGYARTALGLDEAAYEQVVILSTDEMRKVADVGAVLFRLKWGDLKSANKMYKKGNADRATSLLSAALVAAGVEKEGEV